MQAWPAFLLSSVLPCPVSKKQHVQDGSLLAVNFSWSIYIGTGQEIMHFVEAF